MLWLRAANMPAYFFVPYRFIDNGLFINNLTCFSYLDSVISASEAILREFRLSV